MINRKLNFSTELYANVTKPRFSKNEKIAYLCGAVALALLGGLHSEMIPENGFIIFILLICAFTPSFINITGIFKEVELNSEHLGMINFTLDKIEWSKETILWTDIHEISMVYFDYRGRFLSSNSLENDRSAGLDNKISILTKDGKEYSANMLMVSEAGCNFLKKVLIEVVKTNEISYKNAKRMINPGNYAEHQELKKYSIL